MSGHGAVRDVSVEARKVSRTVGRSSGLVSRMMGRFGRVLSIILIPDEGLSAHAEGDKIPVPGSLWGEEWLNLVWRVIKACMALSGLSSVRKMMAALRPLPER